MTTYPSRIVCLTEETTETLYLLGEGHRVVGVSGYTMRPPEARGSTTASKRWNRTWCSASRICRPTWRPT
jgi:ABC-type hemin transport system substrate-binding protein